MIEIDAERILNMLRKFPADEAEIVIWSEKKGLTRYAGNVIHQNMVTAQHTVWARVNRRRQIGVYITNRMDEDSLREALRQAETIAAAGPPNMNWTALPEESRPTPLSSRVDPETENCSPQDRAGRVEGMIALWKKHQSRGAGALSTQTDRLQVFNSHGLYRSYKKTLAVVSCIVQKADGSGFEQAASYSITGLDTGAMAAEALDIAQRAASPRRMEPGLYDVVLSPYAVADLIEMLSFMGFSALKEREGESFLSGRMGKVVTGKNIHIWDDGNDPEGLALPFDFTGTTKERVDIIKSGIALNTVHDLLTAVKEKRLSTGHALPPDRQHTGPAAFHLFMAGGDLTEPELLSRLGKGLYIKRFHYTNPVRPRESVITGMTRDGLFWVEGGRIQYAVNNMRFTQSILDAFLRVEQLGRRKLIPLDNIGSIVAPALLIRGFRFTGA